MKKINLSRFCLQALSMLFLFSACTRVEMEEMENEKQAYSLKVNTRAGQGSNLSYPIMVFAFREDGTLADSFELTSSGDKLSFNLAEGNYHLVALANHYHYSLPEEYTYSSVLQMPAEHYSTDPLMVGNASVSLGKSSQTVNITMSYVVCSLSIALTDVPEDVTGVDVCLANIQTTRSIAGECSGSESVQIPCVEEDGVWQTGTFYVLGSQSNPIISITLTNDEESVTYGYTYSTRLIPGSPYRFCGSYQDGLVISGNLSSPAWGNLVEVGFTFGPGATDKPDDIYVDALPSAGSIWNGHLVAKTMNTTESESDLLLLSLEEWADLTSAYYTADPYVAERIKVEYSEDNLSEWRIPTKDEATVLKGTYYGTDLQAFNTVIESANGTCISDEDGNGTNVRYLCEDATYTYAFKNSVGITKAGSTVTTYRLRLVKTVHVLLRGS